MNPLTLMLLGQGAGITASLFGSWAANKKSQKAQQDYMNKANERYAKDKTELDAWKAKNSANILDTEGGRSLVELIMQNARDNNDVVSSNAAMTGATNANITAQKKATQSNVVDALRRLSAQGDANQKQTDALYFNQNGMLSSQKGQIDLTNMNMDVQNNNNKVSQWSNFVNNLSNLGTSYAMFQGMGTGDLFGDNWWQRTFNPSGRMEHLNRIKSAYWD